MIRLYRRGWPLFLRIFAVMLVSVTVVQVASFALLIAAGPPAAELRTLDQVAAALSRGGDPHHDLQLAITDEPPISEGTSPLTKLLAAKLAVPEGRVRLSHGFHPHGPPVHFFPTLGGPPAHDARTEVLVGRFVAAVQRQDGQWLTVRPVHNEWEAWRRNALLWLAAAAFAVAPFAWLLARWLARPVKLFAAAAERLGRDPRAPLLAVAGPPEIAEAAETFNRMQQRLARYVEDRTNMIGAIAHDLRTPLMRLSLRLKGAPTELARAAESDIAEMEAMIAAIVSFVRDATQTTDRRSLDLRSLIASVTDELADQGSAVSFAPGDMLPIEGNPVALKALVSNLVVNAVKHAGDAEVSLQREQAQAVIEVRDHGPGIAPADLPRVFEPFFRGEPSRNRVTGGLGLGLASVRAIALAHGGDAQIYNHPDGGSIARISLPLAASN